MTKSSTRASIVDAAVAVAARRGISGSSMDEIAEQGDEVRVLGSYPVAIL